MRIVSQDKRIDINYDIVALKVEGVGINCYPQVETWFEIASYDTQKRALEVMNEIRKAYRENQAFLERVDMIEGKKVTHLDYTTYFYMPKE